MKILLAAENMLVCIKVAGGTTAQAIRFAVLQPAGDRRHDCSRNFILKREHIDKIAIIAIRPQMIARRGADQLSGYAYPVRGLPDRTFEYKSHAERPADFPDVDGPSAKNE